MRALVTGGAGFIGSHITEALLAAGHEVVVLDDLSTGHRESVPAGAIFVEGDIVDSNNVDRTFDEHRPQWVCHQAAQASVSRSVQDPVRDAAVNVLGTINVLAAADRADAEAFVYAGTGGALYGEVPPGELAGATWPPRPVSPYGCSKLAGEGYVRAAGQTSRLRTTILRYSNVYGPRQDPHGEAGVVAIFTRALLAGDSVRLFAMASVGDAGCVRDYVHVDDVARANFAALAGDVDVDVLDVASGTGTSTRDLLRALEGLVGVEAVVEDRPPRPGDLQRVVLDPAPFAERLGDPVPLQPGLERTVAWFRGRPHGSQ